MQTKYIKCHMTNLINIEIHFQFSIYTLMFLDEIILTKEMYGIIPGKKLFKEELKGIKCKRPK